MKLASGLYWIVGIVNLYACYSGDISINHFTKPLLMPILIYLIFLRSKGHVTLPRLLLALAFIFAWFGDLLLMFTGEDWYFLAGLGSFLIMQIIYCVVFKKSMNQEPSFSWKTASPLLILMVLVMLFIVPQTGDLQIPVSIYAICITTMLGFALFRKGMTSTSSYQQVMIGALLFVISDALIGVSKFMLDLPLAKVWIMVTYIPAQYLIMSGVVKHEED
ncbi:MAG: lysoplasmalogenase [Marinoscillum sp.]